MHFRADLGLFPVRRKEKTIPDGPEWFDKISYLRGLDGLAAYNFSLIRAALP